MLTSTQRLEKCMVLMAIILDDLSHPLCSKLDAELHQTLNQLQRICDAILDEMENKKCGQ